MNDESVFIESDADEQIIIHIPFTGHVKLRSILIKCGPSEHTPDKCKVFSNELLDFEDALTAVPTQEFEVAQSRDMVEYSVRPARFSSIRNLTIFFPSNHGDEVTRIYFIGFYGEFSALKRDPLLTVYELQANPADHPKIQGTDSLQSQFPRS